VFVALSWTGLFPVDSAVAVLPAKCVVLTCYGSGDGLAASLTEVAHEKTDGRIGRKSRTRPVSAARRQYMLTPACPTNSPEAASFDISCHYAVTTCALTGQPAGIMSWSRVGGSCPSRNREAETREVPELTQGMIRSAFRRVHFARPEVSMQPAGNQTLVNFETFYRVAWPEIGVGPKEIVSVTMLQRHVRIRAAVRTYTYSFGDGTSAGPTSDAGGVYPTGRIRHTYVSAGSVGVRVRAVYTGDFSVDGGPWESVDDTVTIAGPVAGLRVREARNQLEAGSEP